jgi:hypothetical protein
MMIHIYIYIYIYAQMYYISLVVVISLMMDQKGSKNTNYMQVHFVALINIYLYSQHIGIFRLLQLVITDVSDDIN